MSEKRMLKEKKIKVVENNLKRKSRLIGNALVTKDSRIGVMIFGENNKEMK